MNKKYLPGTDIELSPITYGAFAIGGWFWGGADEGDAIRAIETALDNGVTTIDTAPVYGMGHSENVVGNTIKGKRDRVQLLTKFGMRWDTTLGDFAFESNDNDGNPVKVYKFNGRQSVIEECDRSLKRLQTDYIDLLQMHWPDSTTPIEETMEALQILKEQGKIRAAGVCNCPVDLLERALQVIPLATNQVGYSMVNRGIEKELVPFCLENGIGILPHTSLQKGLLTGKIKIGHKFNEGDHRPNNIYFNQHNHQEIMNLLQSIQLIASERNISLAQLAINWTMQQPAVTSVLVGARNSEQMLDNVKAASFLLSPEELSTIDVALRQMDLKL